jgi:hypothetical protein
MLIRFVTAMSIGALLIAFAAFGLVLIPGAMAKMWPLTTIWCFVPLVWGIWALLAPKAWVPERLPYWGAILGFVAGTFGAFVLNMPYRIFETPVSFAERFMAVLVMTVIYYFVWMLVRLACRSLFSEQTTLKSITTPPVKRAA